MCACVRMHWAHCMSNLESNIPFSTQPFTLESFVVQAKQTMICRIKRIVSLLSFSIFLSCHIHDGLSQGANLAPSPGSSNCDKFKYEEWLKMQEKEGGDTNQQALDKPLSKGQERKQTAPNLVPPLKSTP